MDSVRLGSGLDVYLKAGGLNADKWTGMSIRTFIREQNAWLVADQIDRLKYALFLLFMGGTTLFGVILLAIGLMR